MSEIINILDDFFPTDISKLILEKVDKDVHRDKLSKCFEHIKIRSLLINYDKISKMVKNWNMIYNKNIIKVYFPDINETLGILNTCNCCERHRINKPIALCSASDTYCLTRLKILNNRKNGCECKCRKLSRLIIKSILCNEEDIIKHQRYFMHSSIKSDILNIEKLVKHIEYDISGIDCTSNDFSHTYNTYIDMISYEKNRVEGLIFYLKMHIQEIPEIILPEDAIISEYMIDLDETTLLNEYMKETEIDYIDYPSHSEDSDTDMDYSEEDSIS